MGRFDDWLQDAARRIYACRSLAGAEGAGAAFGLSKAAEIVAFEAEHHQRGSTEWFDAETRLVAWRGQAGSKIAEMFFDRAVDTFKRHRLAN